MKKYIVFLIILMLGMASPLKAKNKTSEKWQVNHFMENWKFWSETQPSPVAVNLPHDAMQTEQRSAEIKEGYHSGYFPGNKYFYEKTLMASDKMLAGHVTIDFEGVYQKSKVFINGKEIGGAVYGYTPFSVCLDGKLRKGKNTILVVADNSKTPNSRWYTGAGIYRPVHLNIQAASYIKNVKVSTLSIAPAQVQVAVQHVGGVVEVNIFDGKHLVASTRNKMLNKSSQGCYVALPIEKAKLWSAENPHLYQAEVSLKQNGKVIETVKKSFGIRQITYSNKGLFVNGKSVLLRGGCLHHDNGILGACEFDEAAERKIRIMKEYGFNAIRSAHNPCSEAILKACDKLGMYVMDELWDVWYDHKTSFDYAGYFLDNYDNDIVSFVNKDFNHPSVIMYSIANEPTEPAHKKGVDMARNIVEKLHNLDSSRPVTAGINMAIIYLSTLNISLTGAAAQQGNKKMSSEQYNAMMTTAGERLMKAVLNPKVDSVTTPVFGTLDIAGYNYGNRRYSVDAKDHPDRVVIGTETYSYSLSENWKQVELLPYLIGDFMWTAWDYIGEAGIGAWYYSDEAPSTSKEYPWLLAGAGALDLLGHPTGEAFRAKAVWTHDNHPYITVRPIHQEKLIKASWRGTNSVPSWSWQGCDGMPTSVEVFTSAKQVNLYLNNQLLGSKETINHLASFDVIYHPGILKAVSISEDGQEYESSLKSASSNLQIKASFDKPEYEVGDLMFVDIDLVDENGIVESKKDTELNISVKGGKLLGFGSAQPKTKERFNAQRYTTYYGRSQAIIKANQKGKIEINVSGKNLINFKKTIKIK